MLNKIYYGDCIKVLPKLASFNLKFDAVITDPPFGITQAEWDTPIPFESMWSSLSSVTKPTTPIILFANEPFTSDLIVSNRKAFKYRIDWKKNKASGFLNAKKQPLRVIEDICVFYNKPPIYNPQKTTDNKPVNSFTRTKTTSLYGEVSDFSGGGSTERYPTNLIEFPVINNDGSSPEGKRRHPTQKPLELLRYLIRTFTNEGDLILDFAGGSCSLAIAALMENRKFIIIERDEEFFNKGNIWLSDFKINLKKGLTSLNDFVTN